MTSSARGDQYSLDNPVLFKHLFTYKIAIWSLVPNGTPRRTLSRLCPRACRYSARTLGRNKQNYILYSIPSVKEILWPKFKNWIVWCTPPNPSKLPLPNHIFQHFEFDFFIILKNKPKNQLSTVLQFRTILNLCSLKLADLPSVRIFFFFVLNGTINLWQGQTNLRLYNINLLNLFSNLCSYQKYRMRVLTFILYTWLLTCAL